MDYKTNRSFSHGDKIQINTLKKKLSFYKTKETEITIRLKDHQNYFVSGIVSKAEEYFCTLEKDNIEIYINYCDIDEETIFPSKINPIRFFIRESISDKLRKEIFERDKNLCQLQLDGCTKVAEEVDHIIPISVGGTNNLDNLQSSCKNCNLKKSNKLLF
ncbi:MAG: HNH endonuclease signature motif containing protein [Clostridia bacterium]|nr:HNH endonuclease signature motif containing protein [Clostridia bacterium]